MGIFGGSSSSSQSLNNAITFNPILTMGDDNDARSENKQSSEATATATAKDELSASVGVGVGGGSGSGGAVQGGTDIQPTTSADSSLKNDFFADKTDTQKYLIIGGVVLALGGLSYYFLKKKK